jgi:putative acetyltransferase
MEVVNLDIKLDDLSGSEVATLIGEHLQGMVLNSPPESIHALNLEGLKKPGITFWSAWEQNELVGCVALKELDGQHGEVKSMRTASLHLRKGVAKRVLAHIIEEAKQRGYQRLSLETGSMAAFEPARKLYESFGFQYCKTFSDYIEDPNSVFMTKEL